MIRVVRVRYEDGSVECRLTGADEVMFKDKRIARATFRSFETMAEAARYMRRAKSGRTVLDIT